MLEKKYVTCDTCGKKFTCKPFREGPIENFCAGPVAGDKRLCICENCSTMTEDEIAKCGIPPYTESVWIQRVDVD